jgi:hypothetical protein
MSAKYRAILLFPFGYPVQQQHQFTINTQHEHQLHRHSTTEPSYTVTWTVGQRSIVFSPSKFSWYGKGNGCGSGGAGCTPCMPKVRKLVIVMMELTGRVNWKTPA